MSTCPRSRPFTSSASPLTGLRNTKLQTKNILALSLKTNWTLFNKLFYALFLERKSEETTSVILVGALSLFFPQCRLKIYEENVKSTCDNHQQLFTPFPPRQLFSNKLLSHLKLSWQFLLSHFINHVWHSADFLWRKVVYHSERKTLDSILQPITSN